MKPVIEIRNLHVEYRAGRKKPVAAIEDISIKVKKGEIFGITGANGAGKTTLLRVLATLILPAGGEVYIDGRHIVRDSEEVKLLIGFHSGEERSLYWRLSGRQNLAFFAALYNLSSCQTKKRIEELFEMLQIKEPDKMVYACSSGMKQKLLIARTLLHDPIVLLLDEPTKSLDAKTAHELRKFLKDECAQKAGKTIVWVTHNLKEAEDVCDRTAVMDKGRIV